MAKKQRNQRDNQDDSRRRTRKEVLRERRDARQTRNVRIAVAAIVGLLVLVFLIAVVVEYMVRPRQPVATVNGADITLNEWQERVRFQRAQFILGLEDQLDAFQDLALVQQFSQQQIALLQQPELLGELMLEQMIDEELVRQAAAERGLEVTDAEVDEQLAEQFSYFGGESPTPLPAPTETIQPTPSLTPIPTDVITEVLPTTTPMPTPSPGATATQRPTATPVSQESFQQELRDLFARYRALGVSEETYREVLRTQLLREKLADHLAEVENLPSEEEMASIYLLSFATEEEAQEALQQLDDEEFLTVWNTIRSIPADAEDAPPGSASEVLWRTSDQLQQQYGAEVAEAAFELELGEPSDVLVQGQPGSDGLENTALPIRYHIIQVSGREVRELAETAFESRKQQLVSDLIEEQRLGGLATIDINPVWRTRVPNQPILDPSFLQPPTSSLPTPE